MITISLLDLTFWYILGVITFGGIYLSGTVSRGYRVDLGDLIIPFFSWAGFLVWMYTLIVDINHRTGLAKILSKPVLVPTPYNQRGLSVLFSVLTLALMVSVVCIRILIG